MRHVLLLPLALLLLALLPAAAQAAAVGKATGQSADEVRAYWTEERMRDAKPKERERGGGPVERAKPSRPGGGGASWTSGAVSFDPTTGDPAANSHGKVFFVEGGVKYQCSGTATTRGSAQIVLTAGHCVHGGPEGDDVTYWEFIPGYGSGTTHAAYVATALYTTEDWAGSGEFGRDIGLARVDRSFGPEISTPRPVNTLSRPALNSRVKSYGYPAAGKFNGRVLRFCDSPITREDTSTTPSAMGIPCDMTAGSSGGGWVAGGSLVSVNSYGYGNLKNTMFGPQLNDNNDLFAAAGATS